MPEQSAAKPMTKRLTKRPSCTHPPVARECHNGYDITCGDCEQLVGRVAIFPDAVLSPAEAKEVLALLPDQDEAKMATGRWKLRHAARKLEEAASATA